MKGIPLPQYQYYYGQQGFQAYPGQMNPIQPLLTPQDQLAALEYQKALLYADIESVNAKMKKVDLVAQKEGANRHFTCTDEYLNKKNSNYRGTMPFEQQNKRADEVASSIQKLDDLLQRKKENKPIPFVDSYTPQRKAKNKIIQKNAKNDQPAYLPGTEVKLSNTMPEKFQHPDHPTYPMMTMLPPQFYPGMPQPQWYTGYYPAQGQAMMPSQHREEQDRDSLENTNPMEQVSENSKEDDEEDEKTPDENSRGVSFPHHGLQKEAEAEGYLNKKKRQVEQLLAKEAKPTKKKEQAADKKHVVVETEHGVLKVANQKHLTDLFS